jgi:V8-like Glu-specific endopeptidase
MNSRVDIRTSEGRKTRMVNLTTDERRQLIALLQGLEEFANEHARRQVLEAAGLKQLLPMINLSGPPFIALNTMISYLCNYGRLTYENEALGLFLNFVKSLVGVEQQEFLDALLIRHNMMIPNTRLSDIPQWQSTETATDVLEKIVGENTLRPIAFLAQGLKVARSVAYISVRLGLNCWAGTGFLITPDVLLTNNHVVPMADLLPNTLIRFNYEEDFQRNSQQPYEYQTKSGGIFHTNKNLDYSLFQVEELPGTQWGWLPLIPQVVRKGDRVNIIQHPNGQPKQVSMQNNFVQYVGSNVVQYVTSTLNGSSGSPVLNDNWELVALHHAGGMLREPNSQHHYFRNEGILIASILADLPLDIRKVIQASKIDEEERN